MRKLILLKAFLCLIYFSALSQTVPNLFCGENAWMPDSIGNWKVNGKLATNWSNVAQSNVRILRYGGYTPDSLRPTNTQYIKIIDSLRAKGIEPIIQVPYLHGTYDSAVAAKLLIASYTSGPAMASYTSP